MYRQYLQVTVLSHTFLYKLVTMHVQLLSTAVFLICYHVHTLQVSTLCFHSFACRYYIFTMYVPGKYTYCKIKCYLNPCHHLLSKSRNWSVLSNLYLYPQNAEGNKIKKSKYQVEGAVLSKDYHIPDIAKYSQSQYQVNIKTL